MSDGGDAPEHPQRALAVAAALAGVAGFVDAHIFLHVAQVFVGNMSGNLINLGIYAGDASWLDVARSLLSIVSFVAGVAFATRWKRADARAHPAGRPHLLIAAESAALFAVTAVLVASGPGRPRFVEIVVIAAAAIAMGVQAVAVVKVGSVAVTTTYESGGLVRVGQSVLHPIVGNGPDDDAKRTRTVVVLLAVISAYAGGAALASAAGSANALLLLPAGVAAVMAVAAAAGDRERSAG